MSFDQYCNKAVEVLERNLDVTHINIEKNILFDLPIFL